MGRAIARLARAGGRAWRHVTPVATCLLILGIAAPVRAQSQAVNGTIEGTVADAQGGILPGVTLTVTNDDTGSRRVVVTNEAGVYRALLLPLGTYRVKAELEGFKAFEREGIRLSAGQVALVNITLDVGAMSEVVSVRAEAAVAQPGKIDLGRVIGETEVKNLPLVSRNPYNFAFLQANVTGYENNEFGVPRINANGTQMRTNYQIDGNTNTQKDRAGLRLLPASEIMVQEVKVVTNGFAPEFGQTTGMVYNAVTPSGTNDVHGSVSYRLRRKGFSARPFFLAPTAPKPDTHVDNWTATAGGPIQRDRWHFYAGWEYVDRDLSADRVITVSDANAQRLGIALPANRVIPASQGVNFVLGKTDYQVNPAHRLSFRYLFFNNDSPYNIGGGLNTVERATDFLDRMDSVSGQLVSTFGATRLNELRVQYARRHQSRAASEGAGTGPAIVVSGAANFGGPIDGAQTAGFDFTQGIWQVVDNYSWIRGRHGFKAGADVQMVKDERVNTLRQIYTFATIDAYLAATSGANRRAYANFVQDLGDPTVSYRSAFYGFFVQDDWQLTPAFKLLFGLRYDLFDVPSARPFAANPLSRDFRIDKNNLAPRVGLSWSLDPNARTVVRAWTGKMYDPPLLNFYEDAILRNGDPRSFTISVGPAAAGAPDFPNNLSSPPPGFVLPRQSIVAVASDFETQGSWMTNIQVERAIADDMSVAIGYVNAIGRNLPVLVDTNMIATGATLADGRPVYSATVNAQTRVDPTFDHVDVFQSAGESTYHAMTMTLTKRMGRGFQAQGTYTLAKGEDNAPLTGTYVVGSIDDRISDPSNIDRDKGPTVFNQTHTFALSTVIAPQVTGGGMAAALLNNNQLGIILQANSGLPFSIRSNRNLNGDGVATNDRPIGIGRNTGRLGSVYVLDLRYSRFIPFGGRYRAEVFVEAKNLFNRENVQAVNRVVATDVAGNPEAALPAVDAFPPTTGYDQRQAQVGFKLVF
jgi:hypothetical protein